MSRDKQYKQKNKICVYFTQAQMDFLNLYAKIQGESKSTIIRRVVNDLLVKEMVKGTIKGNKK